MDPTSDLQPEKAREKPLTEVAVRPHIIRGSFWMIVMRWSIRGIGLVSTLILVRLLTPEDFGLVSMAMLVVGLIEVFGETGQQLALIRFANPTREHYDSAWTAQILVSLILGTIVLLAAPLAPLYFGDPRTELLVQVLSIRVYAIGFENIGTVQFRKNLDFVKEFRYGVYKKLIPFFITIGCAFALRNYWALVIGIVAGQVVAVLLSYILHPYRPRICFAKIKEIWSFSIWILVSGVGAFIYSRAGGYVVGGMGNPRGLGHYSIAAQVAMLPTVEVIVPMSRALFPTYAKLAKDPRELRTAYLNVLSVIAIMAAAISTGMALVSEDLVMLAFGETWRAAAPLVFWLAFAGGIGAISNSVMLILQAVADPRRVAIQSWTRVLLMAPVYAIALQWNSVEAIAVARFVAAVLVMPTFFFQLLRALPVSIGQILEAVWRPMIAAGAMAAAVIGLSTELTGSPHIVRLAVEVPAGAIVYVVVLFLLWLAAGRPPGAERAAMRFLGSRILQRAPAA